jgi:tetratricopeptide (TPR) repeat protein
VLVNIVGKKYDFEVLFFAGKNRCLAHAAVAGFVILSGLQSANLNAALDKPEQADTGSRFDPVGKSFLDLVLEGQRAFEAGEYDRVILLMNYALTLDLNKPQAAAAMINRGSAYALKDELDRAMEDFDVGLKRNPRDPEGYRNRGLALVRNGELDAAQKDFNQALQLNPNQWKTYLNRAGTFRLEHNLPAALHDIERALQINSKCADAHAERAAIYVRLRRNDEAVTEAAKAISFDHTSLMAHVARVNAYVRLKRYDEARRDLQTVALLRPKDPARALNAVAWIKATCQESTMRNGSEAVDLARKACEATGWKRWGDVDTLAAACAEAGDFNSAVKYQQQVLSLTEKHPPPNRAELIERVALFQKHEPYRDEMKP